MRIDNTGRDFIYKQEGVKLKAYKDVAGIPTIGVGFTFYPGGKKVAMGDVITLAQCDTMFTAIVSNFEDAVTKAVKVPINQNQFNALVSFSFNVGTVAFSSSTLLKKINSKSPEADIRAQFALWKKAGGKIVDDLVERRKDEADLYFKPISNEDHNH